MFYIITMVCVNSLRTVGKQTLSHNFPLIRYSRSFMTEECDSFVSSMSKKYSTNPLLDAVKKAVPFEKEPRITIADSLHDMIIDVTKVKTEAVGKDAIVYSIPNHNDMVLRVEKTALEKINDLGSDLEPVPISYSDKIKSNKNLGLPLYFVAEKGSKIAKKSKISPQEALAQTDKIMVLRRVSGKHPACDCGEKLVSMLGVNDSGNLDLDSLNNFSYVFGYVAKNYGYESVQKCLKMFEQGALEIPANFFGEGSKQFNVVNGKNFFGKYKEFTSKYIDYLKDVSELPQNAYDDAVKFVAAPKSFNVDFQHTNNTFVDLEKKEFNFMDFAFDKKDEKYIYENPVKEFRNVLLGKSFISLDALRKYFPKLPCFQYPRSLVYCPEDISEVKKYSKTINDKINFSAPNELKSENPFR